MNVYRGGSLHQFLPDVPTAVEEGYDVPVSQYRAVAAPKGLPADVKARLVESIDAAIAIVILTIVIDRLTQNLVRTGKDTA